MVCLAHICLQLGLNDIGRFLAYLFVDVFLFLSAFLLGLGHGESPVGLAFMKKRYLRLSVVYYPFLMISIMLLILFGKHIDVKSIVLHFTYANYIVNNKLYDVPFGHLWYLSIQMVSYLLITMLFCKGLYYKSKWLLGSRTGIAVLGVIAALGGGFLTSLGLPNRVSVVLFTYVVVFSRTGDILDWAKRIPPRMCLGIFVLLNVITLLLFLFWDLEGKIIVRDWLVAVTSLSWLIYYLKPTRELFPKPIAFLSTISFEIYLVHHPLVFGVGFTEVMVAHSL